MPFCDPVNVPFVVSERQRLNPRSVIDVGLRLLMRAAVRSVWRQLSGSAPVTGIAAP